MTTKKHYLLRLSKTWLRLYAGAAARNGNIALSKRLTSLHTSR